MSRRTNWVPFQTLTGEMFDSRSTIVRDEARLGISTREFCTKYQMAFFWRKGFWPKRQEYKSKNLQQRCRTNEMENKGIYNKRILQVENGSSTQVVFLINGGMEKNQ